MATPKDDYLNGISLDSFPLLSSRSPDPTAAEGRQEVASLASTNTLTSTTSIPGDAQNSLSKVTKADTSDFGIRLAGKSPAFMITNRKRRGHASVESEELPSIRESSYFNGHGKAQLGTSWLKRLATGLRALLFFLLPIAYIGFAIALLRLNGQVVDEFKYDTLVNIYKTASTVWPVYFAGSLGSTMRNIANFRLRKGAPLITLERLMKCQNLVSTYSSFWSFGYFSGLGISVALLWTLSPLTSQALLRMFFTITSTNTASIPASYVNSSFPSPVFDGPSTTPLSLVLVNAIFITSLFAPDSTQLSPIDSWGNPKIPFLESLSVKTSDGWSNTSSTNSANVSFSSLLGIPIAGIPGRGSTNVTVETTYLSLDCGPFEMILLNDSIWPGSDPASVGSFFLGMGQKANATDEPEPDDVHDVHRLLFLTQYTCGSECNITDWSRENPAKSAVPFYQSICTVSWHPVEANVLCEGRNCQVVRVRPLQSNSMAMSYDDPLEFFYRYFQTASGRQFGPFISLTEQYLFSPGDARGIDAGTLDDIAGLVEWKNATIDVSSFSKRLSRLLNTYWMAGYAPAAQVNGLADVFPPNSTVDGGLSNITGTLTTENTVYAVNKGWMAVVLVSSGVLLLAAIVLTVLESTGPSPDVLGYVGSMLRDNPHAPIPPGRSALDGGDFARAAGDLRVRLADVCGEDEVGHIAVTTRNGRPLQLGRKYW